MVLRYNDQTINKLYYNGAELRNLRYNDQLIWARGSAPAITSFTVTPDRLLTSAPAQNITLQFAVTGSTRNVITETLSDGTIRNVPLSGQTTVIPAPSLTARYRLTSTNANGTTTRDIVFTRGIVPIIRTWSWGGFRQGIAGRTPDSVLLTWAVSGTPAPQIDITPSINYHPPTLTGTYRLSRVGAGTSQTLTLVATNIFGTVRQALTINWPPLQGG